MTANSARITIVKLETSFLIIYNKEGQGNLLVDDVRMKLATVNAV